MNKKAQKNIQSQKQRRIARVRARISGTAKRPRLAVHRTLRSFSAQLIDDAAGKTLVAVHQRELGKKKMKPVERAAELGKLMGKKALDAGVKEIVFDRRSYQYHGRVKAFADAAREAGLQF